MIRQYEIGQSVRVRPVLYLPATPETTYRVRARHTYPAKVVETFHHPVGTFIRVVLEEHNSIALSDAHREMLVPPVDVHHWKCDCRRCSKRPASRGLDYSRARFRRWASVAWAKWENLFDY
jgi:hypothetical protein